MNFEHTQYEWVVGGRLQVDKLTSTLSKFTGTVAFIALINRDRSAYSTAQEFFKGLGRVNSDPNRMDKFLSDSRDKTQLEEYARRNKSLYKEVQGLEKKSARLASFYFQGSDFYVRTGNLYKRKWPQFSHKHGIYTDGGKILEVTGQPKEDKSPFDRKSTPQIKALDLLSSLSNERDVKERAERATRYLSLDKDLPEDLRKLIRIDLYHADLDGEVSLFEKPGDLDISVAVKVQALSDGRDKTYGSTAKNELTKFIRKLKDGEELDEEARKWVYKYLSDYDGLDKVKKILEGGRVGDLIDTEPLVEKIEALAMLRENVDSSEQSFLDLVQKEIRRGNALEPENLKKLLGLLRANEMAEYGPLFGSAAVDGKDGFITEEKMEILDHLEEIAFEKGNSWLQDFIPSIKDQIERGKDLSDKQLSAIRRNLYENDMRDKADLFRREASSNLYNNLVQLRERKPHLKPYLNPILSSYRKN